MAVIELTVIATLAAASANLARRWYRRYCDESVKLYMSLIDSDVTDVDMKELMKFCKDSVAEVPSDCCENVPRELDVVISGGGFKCLYAAGILQVLQERGVKLERFAGTSAGAQLAFLLMNGMMTSGVRWLYAVATTLEQYPWAYAEPFWSYFYKRCAREAELPRPGRFGVSVTEVIKWFPPKGRHCMVRTYTDCEDLGVALMATGSVPFLTCGLRGCPFHNGHVIDGGITVNCPCFYDGERPQITISYEGLDLHWQGRMCGLFFTYDEMLELIRSGIRDGCRLLQGEKLLGVNVLVDPPASPNNTHTTLFALLKGTIQAYSMSGWKQSSRK